MLQNRAVLGISLMILGLALYALSDACVKHLMESYSVPQTMFLRSFCRLIPLLVFASLQGGVTSLLATQHPKTHAIRLLVNLAYTAAFMYAYSMGSLTVVYTLSYTSPFFIILLSALMLKETVSRDQWIAVAIGMSGVLLAMKPGSHLIAIVAPLVLVGTFLGALNKILMRRLAATEHSLAIVIYPNLTMIAITSFFLAHAWQPMPWEHWAQFAFVGLVTAAGQYAIAQAFRFAQGSVLASVDYSSFFWVVLFDYLYWQTTVEISTLLGAAIIVGSNLYILYCTRRQEAKKKAAATAGG